MESVVSRRKLFNGLLLAFTAGFAIFAVLAPTSVVRPAALTVLGLIAAGAIAVVAQAIYLVRRRANQNQPSA